MSPATQIAAQLAAHAEDVCRTYLPAGRRSGRYWLVGDIGNTPGRSLFVRLTGPATGPGAAGKWMDAATGQHGDLIDLIRMARHLDSLAETLAEARCFLALPHPPIAQPAPPDARNAPRTSRITALRLYSAARSIAGTLADRYLRHRAITAPFNGLPLRFHPTCYYRPDDGGPLQTWPALIAGVTDLHGSFTGLHRTWLARDGCAKAPIPDPRRAMGNLLGNGVRFGAAAQVLAAGEGIETMLAIRSLIPNLPAVAALSAAHLAALMLPPGLQRLYIAVDADAAGHRATQVLTERALSLAIAAHPLHPTLADWNADLMSLPRAAVIANLRAQLHPCDRAPLPVAVAPITPA